MKRFALLGATIILLSLLNVECSRSGETLKIINSGGAAPANQPIASPTEAENLNREDQFAFKFEQGEVQLGAHSKMISRELVTEHIPFRFKIDISFPQIEGNLSKAQRQFNLAVSSLAHKSFRDYKRLQLRPMSKAERFPRYHEDVVEFLKVSYDLPFFTEDIVSVRFYGSTYGRGAAHAVNNFFTFNYELESGRQVRLSDLFESPSRGLMLVSKYSAEVVKRKICREGGWGDAQTFEDCIKKAPLWEEGIKATRENFDAWNITKEGLLFSFDPCQLTGCAGGEFYVNVPYPQIKGLMKPNKLISRIASS